MTDVVFWAWLQDAIGLGSVRADRIIRELSSPEALYGKSARELEALGMFAQRRLSACAQPRSTGRGSRLRRPSGSDVWRLGRIILTIPKL